MKDNKETMDAVIQKNGEYWSKLIQDNYQLALSVDCVIFGYDKLDLKVLLINSDMLKYKDQLSLPGDLVNSNETLEQAAQRVLKNRTGLTDVYMEQVMAFSEVNRHPYGRVVTIAYYSLLAIDDYEMLDIENMHPNWYSIRDIDALAFDHMDILNTCLKRLRLRLQESPVGFKLLPKKFTLMQIQNLYEMVLGINLDKRNFRRKLKALDFLIDIGEMQKNVTHRPAKLYSFDTEKYLNEKKKGMFIKF